MRNFRKQILAAFMAITALAGTVAYADSTTPVAENMELTTYRNTSVGGRMSANAPKGTELEYIITTEPVKGSLEVSDDGHFIYTPGENKKGRDYFGYKAVDKNGCESQEATVIIRIQRKAPTIRYTDTQGLGCDFAASHLAEEGIFTGIQVGGDFYFHPDDIMMRDEFTAMCRALDTDTSPEMTTTLKENDSLNFEEASVIINELLHISPVACMEIDVLSDAEENSLQAVSNLMGCGILPDSTVPLREPLSRAEAANMILRACKILKER